MSNKLNITYIIPSTFAGGGLYVICEHAVRLKKKGHNVTFVSLRDYNLKINWFADFDIPIVSLNNAPQDIDILIATWWETVYVAENINAKAKFYLIQGQENSFYPEEREFERFFATQTYKFNYHFITVAKWLAKWIENTYNKDAFLIPNQINTDIFYPITNNNRTLNNRIRVLIEGPIEKEYKGVNDALKIAKEAGAEVWLVTNSNIDNDKERIADKVFSRIPIYKMREIYLSCDILLKLSRVDSFSYPPLEMMACGGIPIVGNVEGIHEYMINGYNGYIFEFGQKKEIIECIKSLQDNYELRKTILKNCRDTVDKHSQWTFWIDKLEDYFYKKLSLACDNKEIRISQQDLSDTYNNIKPYIKLNEMRKMIYLPDIYLLNQSSIEDINSILINSKGSVLSDASTTNKLHCTLDKLVSANAILNNILTFDNSEFQTTKWKLVRKLLKYLQKLPFFKKL